MKNQNLKLEFIENGRLSNGEMGEIFGGKENCGKLTECTEPGSGHGKRECIRYRDCDTSWDRFKCGTYTNFVIGFNYTFDAIDSVWYVEAAS